MGNRFRFYKDLSDQERINFNKKLVKDFPFLLPKDKRDKTYNYSWTYADEIPYGWLLAFGEQFFNELKKELIKYNFLNKYKVLQIKEKFGSLRWYDCGQPKGSLIEDIIEKYSTLSENICINCGQPDVPMVNDYWISPYCKNCWIDHYKKNYPSFEISNKEIIDEYKELTKDSDKKMKNKYEYTRYYKNKKEEIIIDISKEANQIRQKYKAWIEK